MLSLHVDQLYSTVSSLSSWWTNSLLFWNPKVRGHVHKTPQLDTKPHGPMVPILPCIRKFSGSNVNPETRWPQWATLRFSSVPPGKFRNAKLNQATASWFYSLSVPLFVIILPILVIRCDAMIARQELVSTTAQYVSPGSIQILSSHFNVVYTVHLVHITSYWPNLITTEFVCQGSFEGHFLEKLRCITKNHKSNLMPCQIRTR